MIGAASSHRVPPEKDAVAVYAQLVAHQFQYVHYILLAIDAVLRVFGRARSEPAFANIAKGCHYCVAAFFCLVEQAVIAHQPVVAAAKSVQRNEKRERFCPLGVIRGGHKNSVRNRLASRLEGVAAMLNTGVVDVAFVVSCGAVSKRCRRKTEHRGCQGCRHEGCRRKGYEQS